MVNCKRLVELKKRLELNMGQGEMGESSQPRKCHELEVGDSLDKRRPSKTWSEVI